MLAAVPCSGVGSQPLSPSLALSHAQLRPGWSWEGPALCEQTAHKGCTPWIPALACLECSREPNSLCQPAEPCQLLDLHALKGQILWILCKALIAPFTSQQMWWRRKRKRKRIAMEQIPHPWLHPGMLWCTNQRGQATEAAAAAFPQGTAERDSLDPSL